MFLRFNKQVSQGPAVHQCSFSPFDSNVVCVTGRDCVKFYRLVDNEVRLLQEVAMKDHNFISHCWLKRPDDFMIAGTDNGKIVLFRSGEKCFTLSCVPAMDTPISSLVPVAGGFIAGTFPGKFLFFSLEFNESSRHILLRDDNFKLVHTVSCELTKKEIMCLALNPSEDKLCALTADGQLLSLPLQSSISMLSLALNTDAIKYTVSSFHSPRAIVGMDVCTRKPLFVTIGKDNTLRVWNIQNHQLDLYKEFGEEMFSVALHPTGLHIAVGFLDKVRVYHILLDDLRLCIELPVKTCKECAFSQGGNLLATVNGNIVSVFDTHSGERVVDLRGHNSKVRSLNWLQSGSTLLSCGQDGVVYLWDLDGPRRTAEFVKKRTMYTSVVIAQGERESQGVSNGVPGASSGESVFVVGSDRVLSELHMPDLSVKRHYDGGTVLSHLAISTSRSVLLASAGEQGKPGHVRAYTYPVTGESVEYPCLGSSIAAMKLTPDGLFLLVADDAGCIALFELKEKQERILLNAGSILPDLVTSKAWNDEVLVTRMELEDRANNISELQTKIEELKLNNEYQLKLKEMTYSEKVKEINGKFLQEIELARHKLDVLREEKADSETECLDRLRLMDEKHQHECQNGEAGFQMKIMMLVDGYQDLIRLRDAQIERLEDQRRQLVVSHGRYVEEVTRDFEQRLEDDRDARTRQENLKADISRELAETGAQLEDDVDTEVENMRRMYKDKLTICRETTLKYKGENGIMKKKGVAMQRDLEDQKEEMRALQEKEQDLHSQIKMLEKEVSAHKKEIKTRDVAINDREKRIFELKKKNQELDKFKFVLDFKIRELKQQVDPRQQEISLMRDHIKQMDEELSKYHQSNCSLDEMIGTLRERIEKFHLEIKTTRQQCNQQENYIESFRSQVQRLVPEILNPKELREQVIKLVEAHDAQGGVKPRIDADVEGEYERHREFLYQSLVQLKKALADGVSEHTATNNELMKGNMSLIDDINKQRDSNKVLKLKVQGDMGELRRAYQVIGAKGERERGRNGDSQVMRGLFEDPETELHMEPEDLTSLLYRNRQRLVALRAAVSDLEVRKRALPLPSRDMAILPPIDGSSIDGKRSNVFVTSSVPPISSFRLHLHGSSLSERESAGLDDLSIAYTEQGREGREDAIDGPVSLGLSGSFRRDDESFNMNLEEEGRRLELEERQWEESIKEEEDEGEEGGGTETA